MSQVFLVLGPAFTQIGSVALEKGQGSSPGEELTEENMTEGCKILSDTGKPNREQPCIFSSRMWLTRHQTKLSDGKSDSNRTSFLAQRTAKLWPALPQGVVDVEFLCGSKAIG